MSSAITNEVCFTVFIRWCIGEIMIESCLFSLTMTETTSQGTLITVTISIKRDTLKALTESGPPGRKFWDYYEAKILAKMSAETCLF